MGSVPLFVRMVMRIFRYIGSKKPYDSSASCTLNEGSSTIKNETDSFKLYGCGICCQSFSTKEETIHCFNSH